jgi:D-sedoheptulose 7-phosphate isomerase
MKDFIANQVQKSYETKQAIYENKDLMDLIYEVSKVTIEAYKNGNKTLIAGNGGSAADAQHIAGEFVSKFYFDRPGLASIALTTNTSIITAVGNDYGYEKLFSRQVQANGVKGDIFLGISTSGNSKNIIEALKECKGKDITTVGLTGESGGEIKELCDYCICIPANEVPRIQESHILVGHIICAVVEEELFGKGFN